MPTTDASSRGREWALVHRRGAFRVLLAGCVVVLLSSCGPPQQSPTVRCGAVNCQVAIPWLPPSVSRWAPLLARASVHHGVDAELLAIVTLVESGGRPGARSPSGAMGLMQIMPATGADIATRRDVSGYREEYLWDPATNIDFGAWYFARQLAAFGSADPAASVEWAAAAYNGGPGRLRRHLRGEATLRDETVRYKYWVRNMWLERRQPSSATFQLWSSAGGQRLVTSAATEMR